MRTLKVTSGQSSGETVEIEREVVVGRENADLTIPDPEMSRRHVVLRPVDQGVALRDLGSLNGTFVNGERIEGEATLDSSASLRVGLTELELQIQLPKAEPAPEERLADPDVTAPRQVVQQPAPAAPGEAERIAEPDVTAAREVAQPDVTAARKVAEPDVTAARDVVDPDVTAARRVADPDVTAQREVPSPPGEAAAPRADAPAAPGRPPEGAERRGRRGLSPAVLVAIGVLIGALIAVIVLLLA